MVSSGAPLGTGAATERNAIRGKADPDFASGWIWLAWSVRNAERLPLPPVDDRISKYRDFAERALRLADTVPEWERHWITGSYYTLLGDDERSTPQYEALLRLRPDHYYALNNLLAAWTQQGFVDPKPWVALVRRGADQRVNEPAITSSAAVTVIIETGSPKAAQPYVDGLHRLAQSAEGIELGAGFWRDFTVVYGLWFSGDLQGTLEHVRGIEKSFKTYPAYPAQVREMAVLGVLGYYLSLGRSSDATRFVASVQSPKDRELGQLALAWGLADGETLRRLLQPYGDRKPNFVLSNFLLSGPVYVRAGLFDLAQRSPGQPALARMERTLADITRGQLLLIEGRHEPAIAALRQGIEAFASNTRPEYYWGCESLADALWRLGRRLALADPDFPLLKELQRRN